MEASEASGAPQQCAFGDPPLIKRQAAAFCTSYNFPHRVYCSSEETSWYWHCVMYAVKEVMYLPSICVSRTQAVACA